MAIDAVFKSKLLRILGDLQNVSDQLVKSTPGQETMLDSILGTPAEAMGNDVLGELQNVILIELPKVQAFKDYVDTL